VLLNGQLHLAGFNPLLDQIYKELIELG
jgi:hypothetical protein